MLSRIQAESDFEIKEHEKESIAEFFHYRKLMQEDLKTRKSYRILSKYFSGKNFVKKQRKDFYDNLTLLFIEYKKNEDSEYLTTLQEISDIVSL